jgi:glutamate-1-semialdehyde 2,1-aminomutase
MDNSDMVKFAKNGSNVTTAAVKLARSYTGRKYILRCTDQPFFSFDDWFIGDTVIKKGIPSEVSSLTLGFNYNDIDSVEKILTDERYKNDIAAVILEPVNVVEPKVFGQENFLEYLRRRTDEMCIVLIFDEIVTGFRLHEKGVQAKYNVKPDLSTFGKAMANGFSLAALCGRKPIMELGGIRKEQDERTFLLSSTYGSEMSSYGAFLETCKVYDEYNVVQHLNNYGKKLKSEMNKISKSFGIQEYFYVDGFDASPYYVTKGLDGQNSYALRTVFNEKMIENSVMMPWMAFSLSHGEDEIEKTLIAVEDSLKEYQRCLEGVDLKSGHIIKPVFRKFN